MAVRYEGDDGWANLEPNQLGEQRQQPYMGKLSVLKAWNEADPPSAFEEKRNQVIYDTYSTNRNPFIDHPEWVEAICSTVIRYTVRPVELPVSSGEFKPP